jgi:hypothetical protein
MTKKTTSKFEWTVEWGDDLVTKSNNLTNKDHIKQRNQICLCWMYNIVNNSAPSYLTDVLPTRISGSTNYSLRKQGKLCHS